MPEFGSTMRPSKSRRNPLTPLAKPYSRANKLSKLQMRVIYHKRLLKAVQNAERFGVRWRFPKGMEGKNAVKITRSRIKQLRREIRLLRESVLPPNQYDPEYSNQKAFVGPNMTPIEDSCDEVQAKTQHMLLDVEVGDTIRICNVSNLT